MTSFSHRHSIEIFTKNSVLVCTVLINSISSFKKTRDCLHPKSAVMWSVISMSCAYTFPMFGMPVKLLVSDREEHLVFVEFAGTSEDAGLLCHP